MKIRFAVVASALAVATALPAADFQVGTGTTFAISGFVGLGLKQATIGSSIRPGLSSETRIDDNTSRIAFSGSAKIADGWNVIFMIGSRFTTDVRPGDKVLGDTVAAGNTLSVGQASGWADDDTWAGISSPYGTIIMGKNSFYWPDTISLGHLAPSLEAPGESYRVWDANGLTTFNILDQAPSLTKTTLLLNNYTLGITRSRNVIRYNSINFSGVDFSLAYTKNAVAGEVWYPGMNTPNSAAPLNGVYTKGYSDGGTTYARIRYNGKGLSLFASYLDQKIQGGVYTPAAYTGPLDTKGYRLGASYKFGFGLKLGVVYDSTELANGISGTGISAYTSWNATTNAPVLGVITPVGSIATGSAKRDAYELAASYPYGDHLFHLTYGKAGNVSSIGATGANQLNVVWDYALTKKTFLGLVYTSLSNDSNGHYAPFLTGYTFGASNPNPAGFNGEKWSQIGLNLHFWF